MAIILEDPLILRSCLHPVRVFDRGYMKGLNITRIQLVVRGADTQCCLLSSQVLEEPTSGELNVCSFAQDGSGDHGDGQEQEQEEEESGNQVQRRKRAEQPAAQPISLPTTRASSTSTSTYCILASI